MWYPVKDTQTDEPDYGATVKVAVPNGLMNVSNGRFLGSEDLKNGYTRWDWEVKNPINTYDITVNVGDYVLLHENYKGLDLDYYVLRDNEAKAKIHFFADLIGAEDAGNHVTVLEVTQMLVADGFDEVRRKTPFFHQHGSHECMVNTYLCLQRDVE